MTIETECHSYSLLVHLTLRQAQDEWLLVLSAKQLKGAVKMTS